MPSWRGGRPLARWNIAAGCPIFLGDGKAGLCRRRPARHHPQEGGEGLGLLRSGGPADPRSEGKEAPQRHRAAPAYTDAWFCPAPNGHILATGYDDAGRKQYRYHPDFRSERESAKYDACASFGKLLPSSASGWRRTSAGAASRASARLPRWCGCSTCRRSASATSNMRGRTTATAQPPCAPTMPRWGGAGSSSTSSARAARSTTSRWRTRTLPARCAGWRTSPERRRGR